MEQQPKPRLMQVEEDGGARRPDELLGEDIVILDQFNVQMPDGRDASKWVVKRANGERQIYWAPGQNPTMQVRDWFKNYHGVPLFARLSRRLNSRNTNVWFIEQREPKEGEEATAGALMRSQARSETPNNAESLDAQLEEIGL